MEGEAGTKGQACGNSTPPPAPTTSRSPILLAALPQLGLMPQGSAEGVAGRIWLAFAYTDLWQGPVGLGVISPTVSDGEPGSEK